MAYGLPHVCESAEVAAALVPLSPKQRRVLRAYVWQVELGEVGVTEWLQQPDCPVGESAWYKSGEKANYLHSPVFQAALAAYLAAGQRWKISQDAKAIERARARIVQAAPVAAERLAEMVEGDLSQLFRVTTRWTPTPYPTEEILEEEKRLDGDGNPERWYRVRCAVLDLTKLADPRVARLVKGFKDSPKTGLSVELYDAQKAAEGLLDRADVKTASKAPTVATVNVTELSDDELLAIAQHGGGGGGEGAAPPA